MSTAIIKPDTKFLSPSACGCFCKKIDRIIVHPVRSSCCAVIGFSYSAQKLFTVIYYSRSFHPVGLTSFGIHIVKLFYRKPCGRRSLACLDSRHCRSLYNLSREMEHCCNFIHIKEKERTYTAWQIAPPFVPLQKPKLAKSISQSPEKEKGAFAICFGIQANSVEIKSIKLIKISKDGRDV